MPKQATPNDPFDDSFYMIQRKIFSFTGRSFYVYNSAGELVLFTKQPPLRMREQIGLYADEEMLSEVLRIEARQIVDFYGTFDLFDASTDATLAVLKRRTLFGVYREQWDVMTPDEEVVGDISDQRGFFSLVRLFTSFLPRTLTFTIGDRQVAAYRQVMTFFNVKIAVQFAPDALPLEKAVGLAGGIMIATDIARQRRE